MKGQVVYRAGNVDDWHIVLTRIPNPSGSGGYWETEVTIPEGRTFLFYHRRKWAARRNLRGLGIRNLRRVR